MWSFLKRIFAFLFSAKGSTPPPPPKEKEDGSDVIIDIDVRIDKEVPQQIEVPDDKEVKEMPSTFFWILDPPHGAHQPGKRSPVLPDGRQYLEYQGMGEVTRMIGEELEKLNIDYAYTIEDQEVVGSALKKRVEFTNTYKSDKPKILVSPHANAGPKITKSGWTRKFRGTETFYYEGSKVSETLAKIFQKCLLDEFGLRNRGVKGARFYILRHTICPAVLTECMFYTNPDEVEILLSEEGRRKIVKAHVDAIMYVEKNGVII